MYDVNVTGMMNDRCVLLFFRADRGRRSHVLVSDASRDAVSTDSRGHVLIPCCIERQIPHIRAASHHAALSLGHRHQLIRSAGGVLRAWAKNSGRTICCLAHCVLHFSALPPASPGIPPTAGSPPTKDGRHGMRPCKTELCGSC